MNAVKQRKEDMKVLPAAFRPCVEGDWEHETPSMEHKTVVMYKHEFQNKYPVLSNVENQKKMAGQITIKLKALGESVTRESIFRYLLKPAVPKLIKHTTEELVQNDYPSLCEEDFWEFIATMQLQSTYLLSTDLAFKQMKDVAMRDGFMLMDKNRYNQILSSLRGFEVTKREAQDDENVWLQQGNVLRNLWELEKLMFQNSILVLSIKKTVF